MILHKDIILSKHSFPVMVISECWMSILFHDLNELDTYFSLHLSPWFNALVKFFISLSRLECLQGKGHVLLISGASLSA